MFSTLETTFLNDSVIIDSVIDNRKFANAYLRDSPFHMKGRNYGLFWTKFPASKFDRKTFLSVTWTGIKYNEINIKNNMNILTFNR